MSKKRRRICDYCGNEFLLEPDDPEMSECSDCEEDNTEVPELEDHLDA